MRAWVVTVAASFAVAMAGFAPVSASPLDRRSEVVSLTSGWLGWWATDAQVLALANSGAVGEVSMWLWNFQGPDDPLCHFDNGDYDKDGQWGECLNVADTWITAKSMRQRDLLRAAGVKVLGTLTSHSRSVSPIGMDDTLLGYLSSSPERFAAEITAFAVNADLDGIDLDLSSQRPMDDTWIFPFEDTGSWKSAAEGWKRLVRSLSELLHDRGMLLSVTVPAARNLVTGSGSAIPSGGFPQYSWGEVAPWIDRLRIMTYDYNYLNPGPISPAPWAESVARSALAEVGKANAHKIWLGVPQYGRNWPLMSDDKYVVESSCPEGWRPSSSPTRTSVTPDSARALAAKHGVAPVWDDTAAEWTFLYWLPSEGRVNGQRIECSIQRQVWFGDTKTAVHRAALAKSVGLGGIATWDFGTTDQQFYSSMLGLAYEAQPPRFTLRASPRVRQGVRLSIAADFKWPEANQDRRPSTLWWAPTLKATKTLIANKQTGVSGYVGYQVRPKATGFWWITLETTNGFTWLAGPAKVTVTK